MSDTDRIREAIDLRSLISESCKLDSGGRGAHENKHDSESGNCLWVDGDGWFCHHCHAGGDVLNWIMDRDGVDFPEALRTAAEITGVSLKGSDPNADRERRAVYDTLKAAAIHFNENLTEAHRSDITARWGITDETMNKLLLGISRNDDSLEAYLKGQGFMHDQMVKSGLFIEWGDTLKSHFQGRYVFPYWKSGVVRYMIARQTDRTPKNRYKVAKYKKLLTHTNKHSFVSEYARNDTIYGVDSLRDATDWCLITEGVTDCIMATQAGIPCISPVTVTFRKADHKQILELVRRFDTVYICNDNETNNAGLEGAISTCEFLEANGTAARMVTLPRQEGVDKIDLAEYLRDHNVGEFKALFDTAVSVWTVKLLRQPVSSDAVENVKTAKKFITGELSQMGAAERVAFIESGVRAYFGLSGVITEMVKATPAPMGDMSSTDRLIALGQQNAVFFHTPNDDCFAAVKLEQGGSAILPVTTKGKFAKILRQKYYIATGKAPQPDTLKNAINTLEAIAWGNGDVKTLHNRVAWQDGKIVYDLTGMNYEAIEITSQSWGLMPHGHILFKRYSHQISQVQPISGCDPWVIFEFVNVPEADHLLVMVYLISCFVPDIAHVMPIITAEHGAAKTTASDMFKSLVDPSVVMGGVSMPIGEDRFNQMLSHHWFIIFDNIDWIQRWQSDALCRAVTGQAIAIRSLYTNEDDTIFKYKMCVGLNGINNAANKADLLDRAIFLKLDPIVVRIPETELWERFNETKPAILGGIFDTLSNALSIFPTIKLDNPPRMADFALWGCAIAEALGRTKDEFLDAYYENIGQVNRAALEASPIGVAIMSLMEQQAEWEGSPSRLLRELDLLAAGLYIDTKSKSWVKSPDALGRRMKTVIPNLRGMGIGVERSKSGDRNYRFFRFSLLKEVSKVSKVSTANEKPHNPKCPTCPEVSKESGHLDPTCPDSGHLDSDQKRQQASTFGHLDTLDTSAPTLKGDGVCGKCGRELSGQIHSGTAGLYEICANCQAEVNIEHGLDLSEGEHIWNRIVSHIERYGRSDAATLRMIGGALCDESFDPDLVQYYINRYTNGHRTFSPHPEGEHATI